MVIAAESKTKSATGMTRRFARFAAVAGLAAVLTIGTATVGTAATMTDSAPARILVTQYAACNGGDDTVGLKAAIAALKTGDEALQSASTVRSPWLYLTPIISN